MLLVDLEQYATIQRLLVVLPAVNVDGTEYVANIFIFPAPEDLVREVLPLECTFIVEPPNVFQSADSLVELLLKNVLNGAVAVCMEP
jgi:hypothetical protein